MSVPLEHEKSNKLGEDPLETPHPSIKSINMCITSLPVEVVSEISSCLDLSEWFALRLTCSALYEKTLEDYAEIFTTVRFMAARDSIDA